MQITGTEGTIRAVVDETSKSLSRTGFHGLGFPALLEARFEADTRKARSYRMWRDGLIAILGLNACLLLDYAIVKDAAWLAIVRQTALISPAALLVNWLVRKNPLGWLRESSVAAAMVAICVTNLVVQGNRTTTANLFGTICTLIAALFIGVVMRLRFPWVAASLCAMLGACLWSLGRAPGMNISSTVVGGSLIVIGLGIILVASRSLEWEERKSYLLCLQRDLQSAELALINEELHRLSSIDKLTALPNRRALEARLEWLWASCALTGQSLSAVVIDVDHFKRVNDVHGHLYGDETLRRIGSLLPQALRSAEDMAARFGGEEFVLLLAHADGAMATTVAERARRLVETAGTPLAGTHPRSTGMWVTVSCGVSSCVPGDSLHWTDLIAAADEALYTAKRAGRNRVEFRSIPDPAQSDAGSGQSMEAEVASTADPKSSKEKSSGVHRPDFVFGRIESLAAGVLANWDFREEKSGMEICRP